MSEYFVEFLSDYDHPTLPIKILVRVEADSYSAAEEKAVKKLRKKVGDAGSTFYSVYDIR